ncbi:MAG: HAD family phosphatase [Treponema sp.]|nr:HAD family phosphatase [Treponema sp.]MCR5124102.1 Cof-type HAD-IIB family hydrolase [Treponema sp.]
MNQKLDVKLIALDLDDTLLNDKAEISDENVAALRKCAERGIYVVLCSGRLEAGIVPFVRRLEIAGREEGRYVIAINGCSVFDMHQRVQILCNKVKGEILLRADEMAREAGLQTQIYSTDTIHYGTLTPWIEMDINLCKVKGVQEDDYPAMLSKGSPKMLVPCDPKNPEKVQELMKKMKDEFKEKAVIFTSKPYFLEILPPDCGKGEAVSWLCERLGFGVEKSMAFGDGMNDESMISKCGYGVAMKNGNEYIKGIADFVTEFDNNESGVGRFLEKFVL